MIVDIGDVAYADYQGKSYKDASESTISKLEQKIIRAVLKNKVHSFWSAHSICKILHHTFEENTSGRQRKWGNITKDSG